MEEDFKSHPIKWLHLSDQIQKSGMVNPDIWIEDVTNCGPTQPYTKTVVGNIEDETEILEASVCTMFDRKHNRIIIKHHI